MNVLEKQIVLKRLLEHTHDVRMNTAFRHTALTRT